MNLKAVLLFCLQIHSGREVQIHDSIFHYDALPGKETVRSTISIRATPDLFKNGKMKLRCLATMFALYSLSKETEIQEDAPQLALIMVPTTHTNEGSYICLPLSMYIGKGFIYIYVSTPNRY